MNNQHCIYRDHVIHAVVMEHPGIPTPWAAGCQITLADGHSTGASRYRCASPFWPIWRAPSAPRWPTASGWWTSIWITA